MGIALSAGNIATLASRSETPHLPAALLACAVAATILIAGRQGAIDLEQHAVHATAGQLFPLKTQGLVFQKAAAHGKNILPLYGSSELLGPRSERASDFFQTAPTGFQVSPVGKPGATSLTILEKIGALGRDLRGKKIAISLSPAWFLIEKTRTDWYGGNFSIEAASALAFNGSLDFELRHEIAQRMSRFPQGLERSPLLAFALDRLAAGGWSDRVIFCALWPLGKLENAVFELQDHFEATTYLLTHRRAAPRRHWANLDWPKLLAGADLRGVMAQKKEKKKWGADDPRVRRVRDAVFVERINAAPEWQDLDLLLRVLAKVHARPLLLSMPFDGHSYDVSGISLVAREAYYKRIRAVAQHYNFPLVEFEEDDDDPLFLDSQHTHLTAKGWLFYNRVLDDFFHGRVLPI